MSSLDQRQATLRDLSNALRDPDNWPTGFSWNYADCNRCAMGLAHRMWPQQVKQPTTEAMTQAFGIEANKASDIFTGAGRHRMSHAGITANQIANLIDELV